MAVCGNYKIVANAVKGKEKKEADRNRSEDVYQIISDIFDFQIIKEREIF